MKRKIIFLLFFQILICPLFSQDITGKWFDVKNAYNGAEITIDKNNETYSATFNWEWKNWYTIINRPVNKIIVKNDSLLFELRDQFGLLNYKLKWDEKTNTYTGFFYENFRRLDSVLFSRIPRKRDLMNTKPAKKNTQDKTL